MKLLEDRCDKELQKLLINNYSERIKMEISSRRQGRQLLYKLKLIEMISTICSQQSNWERVVIFPSLEKVKS
jgi:hypothetical protein